MFQSIKRYGSTLLRAPALVAVAVVGCLCGPTVPARAGYYTQMSQTGGQMNVNGQPTDYMAGSGVYGAATGGWGVANINCSGDITTTFYWVPDGPGDNAPAQVIIAENCSAGWTGYSYEGTTGSADNGLGFPQVLNPDGSGGSSQGTRYEIVPGTDTLQVTASPSASVFAFQGTYGISVWYSVTASPLEVDLSGGIGLGDGKEYLPGQQVGAGLNPGGLQVDPNSYQWTVSGCSPFLSYVIAQDGSSATFTPYAPQTTSTFIFYFANPTARQATVTCDAHLNVPDGAMPQGGLSVTVVRQCQVDPPTFDITRTFGRTELPQDGQGNLFMELSQIPANPAGTEWWGWVKLPPQFSSLGSGGWGYAQLWTPNRTIVDSGVNEHLTINGITGADTGFPYDGAWYPDDGSQYPEGDFPGTQLTSTMTAASASDNFTTYMMYLPPGNGSTYVPLRSWPWSWVGSTSRPNTTSLWMNPPADASNMGATTDYPPHPQWQVKHSKGGGSFVP